MIKDQIGDLDNNYLGRSTTQCNFRYSWFDFGGGDINLEVVGVWSREWIEYIKVELVLFESTISLILFVKPIKSNLSKCYINLSIFTLEFSFVLQLTHINIGQL